MKSVLSSSFFFSSEHAKIIFILKNVQSLFKKNLPGDFQIWQHRQLV